SNEYITSTSMSSKELILVIWSLIGSLIASKKRGELLLILQQIKRKTVTSSNTKMHNKISITPISLIIIHLLISILFFKFFRSTTKDFLQKRDLIILIFSTATTRSNIFQFLIYIIIIY